MSLASSAWRAGPVDGLRHAWDFTALPPSLGNRLQRTLTFPFHARARPPHQVLRAVTPRPMWAVYFIYAPDGELAPHHHFTLARLRETGWPLLVVCATARSGEVPEALFSQAEAVCWKGLAGYDFSAYTLALEEIAKRSPGAEVFVMNDSVYGPFADLRAVREQARWDLTGFTASSHSTHHIQSYAFFLKDVTPTRLAQLRPVFLSHSSFDETDDAILWQELRFAAVASRHMTVGAFWFSPGGFGQDPTLIRPFPLLDAGFPFLKRSLLTKHSHFQPHDEVRRRLAAFGHPPA